MKKILRISISIFIFAISTSYNTVENTDFITDLIKVLKTSNKGILNQLKFDGFYNRINCSPDFFCKNSMNINGFIFFTPKGVIYNAEFSYNCTAPFLQTTFSNNKNNYKQFCGVYTITNDTILAIIPSVFWLGGLRPRTYLSYYKGIIKNANEIENWRMVKPYPNIKDRFNEETLIENLTPHTLYFIKDTAVLSLDTNKIWFNKYKQYEKKN